jgi:addiction module HigA family antidote
VNELREIIAISAGFTGAAELSNQLRGWVHMALDIGNDAGTAGEFELVGSLQIEPEFRIGFEDFMKPLRLTVNKLAIDLHVPATRIGEIVQQRLRVSADTALRLARYFEENHSGMNRRKQLGLLHTLPVVRAKLATTHLPSRETVAIKGSSTRRDLV